MAKTESETAKELRDKFLTRSGGKEALSAILSGLFLFILLTAAATTDGWLAFGLWIIVVTQVTAIVTRIYGWKTVVLTLSEQEFLRQNYKL